MRRERHHLGAFTPAPPMAWSGWRLRVPGGPDGGQYHGFIAQENFQGGDDQLLNPTLVPGQPAPYPHPSPWDSVWGGIALAEGETRSDFVYRSSAEIPPRPNASGGAHVVNAYQTERSPGYAEAPGNYAALGGPVVAAPYDDGLETWGPGATARVTQPPPPTGPGSGYIVRGTVPPISPTPSPTVRVQHLGATAATPPVVPDPITAWLSESTIIPGVENMWLAGAAAIAAFFLLRGSK